MHRSSPSPRWRVYIKPDQQQRRPGAHQGDAPDFADTRTAGQIEGDEHHDKAGQELSPPKTMEEWLTQVKFFNGNTFHDKKIYG